jgi:hypothetical protein
LKRSSLGSRAAPTRARSSRLDSSGKRTKGRSFSMRWGTYRRKFSPSCCVPSRRGR